MAMSGEEIERRIKASIEGAQVVMKDLAGDGDHWQVLVKSSEFKGKPRVKQHKMVYEALGEDMGTVLHALAVKTEVI